MAEVIREPPTSSAQQDEHTERFLPDTGHSRSNKRKDCVTPKRTLVLINDDTQTQAHGNVIRLVFRHRGVSRPFSAIRVRMKLGTSGAWKAASKLIQVVWYVVKKG